MTLNLLHILRCTTNIRRMIRSKTALLAPVMLCILTLAVSAQDVTDSEPALTNPDRIHTAGLTFSSVYKTLESRYGDEIENLNYSVTEAGLNYGSFTGGRLGFVSDVNLCVPLITRFESDTTTGFGGLSLGFLGGIGWNLRWDKIGLQPYTGFHFNYMLLVEDPIDQKMSNHILSFGLGAGSRIFYSIRDGHNLFVGLNLNLDTIEFTSASYDSREIKLLYNLSWLVSAGYAWTL